MKKTLVFTPALSYESLDYPVNAPEENPLRKMRVFDISTPEQERAVKVKLLREQGVELEDLYYQKGISLVEPQEPKLSLRDAGDPKKVSQATEHYERELAEYEELMEHHELMEDFLAGTTEDLPEELLDFLWTQFERVEQDGDVIIPQAYVFNVEN